MPPKKKSNKKADDSWEEELGEPAPPAEAPDVKDEPAEADAEEEFPTGGLMAMMRKKQKKKNKATEEADEDLNEKAPVEASLDDEFALPDKKGKGKAGPAKTDGAEDDEMGADGKVMTKAQKEKARKEREKQRKKENVETTYLLNILLLLLTLSRLLRRKPPVLQLRLLRRFWRPRLKKQSLLQVVSRRSLHLHLQSFKHSKRNGAFWKRRGRKPRLPRRLVLQRLSDKRQRKRREERRQRH